jgi:mycothiol synthase
VTTRATLASRPFRTDDDADWWAVRELLVRSHQASPPGWNWDVRRWDGSRFHREDPRLPGWFSAATRLWEAGDGRLVGAVHPEGPDEIFLELDPDFRGLEGELLDWAEANRAADTNGRRVLELFAWDYDLSRRELLRERGYEELQAGGWQRRLRFGGWEIERPGATPGYRLRSTGEDTLDGDAARMAALLNAAFGRTIHSAAEYRTFATASPSFRHDLNLVAEAADRSFAAHVGLTLDEVNGHGIIEPVCTHPGHRRQGLARALILEGLKRLRDQGATTCSVETGDMEPANALYRAIGFTEEYRGHSWRPEYRAG